MLEVAQNERSSETGVDLSIRSIPAKLFPEAADFIAERLKSSIMWASLLQ